MAKYRHVYGEFWEDPKVQEEFTAEDRYFYLYLLTNPHTTQIGIYPITAKQIAFDIGHSIESAKALMKRFETDYKVIRYNTETRELVMLNWAKYNLNKGGKPMIDCVRRELSEVKDVSMILEVASKVPNEDIKKLFDSYDDTLNDTSNESYDDTSTSSGQKEKENKKRKRKQKRTERDRRGRCCLCV